MANKENRVFCNVKGCTESTTAKGLCNKHYLRKWRNGDPNIGKDYRPRGQTAEDRFNSIGWVVQPAGCWDWAGALDGSGYGQFFVTEVKGSRRGVKAHRLSLEKKIGRSLGGSGSEKEYALHSCDNRKCVNPDHLRVGTQAENTQDMLDRGRQFRKLTDDEVTALKRDRQAGMLQREIAEKYGVSQSTVSEIENGKKRRQR